MAALLENVKPISAIFGRLVFRAMMAFSVSASPDSWIDGAPWEAAAPAPVGAGLVPDAPGFAPAPPPAGSAGAVGASPLPPPLTPPDAPPPSAGSSKAAIPLGVPTPVGPS